MTLFLLLLCFWWFESLAALVSSYTFILWETHKLTNTQSCVFIFKDHFILSLFVCLFKGGVLVLHACLTNWILICSVPQSLDPTPHPGGCIIGTRHWNGQDLVKLQLCAITWCIHFLLRRLHTRLGKCI